MGKRGPSPTPTALRIVKGNPGRRPLPKGEPKPSSSGEVPKAPGWLRPAAAAEWERVADELHRLGILTRVDLTTLGVYCELVADFLEASRFLEEHGSTYTLRDKDGNVRYVQQFPQVSIKRACATEIRQYAAHFGLTPSGRVGLTGLGDVDDGGDGLDEF